MVRGPWGSPWAVIGAYILASAGYELHFWPTRRWKSGVVTLCKVVAREKLEYMLVGSVFRFGQPLRSYGPETKKSEIWPKLPDFSRFSTLFEHWRPNGAEFRKSS